MADITIAHIIVLSNGRTQNHGLLYAVGSGATSMKVPAIGAPSPVAAANELILNRLVGVLELTSVCELNPAGWLKRRKM